MFTAFHSGTHTGVHWHPSGPEALLETALIEIEEKDEKAKTEIWVWKVHEVALHEANQREGPLMFGGIEPLLKKVSEEVTRKAQEEYRAARGKQ